MQPAELTNLSGEISDLEWDQLTRTHNNTHRLTVHNKQQHVYYILDLLSGESVGPLWDSQAVMSA